MTAVTTSIDSATGGLKLVWTTPADGSDTIDRYAIEVKNSAGAWVGPPAGCGGTGSPTMATMVSSKTCIIPMSTLTGSGTGEYGLAFDTLVEVRAAAGNSFGVGTPSPTNTAGAKTRRIPS